MNNQEKQIQHLETRMESTRNAFRDLADKFISRIKEKIREKSTPKKSKNSLNSQPLWCVTEGIIEKLPQVIHLQLPLTSTSFLKKKRTCNFTISSLEVCKSRSLICTKLRNVPLVLYLV
jgi:hypothetical protein